jgi:hypothetical protein
MPPLESSLFPDADVDLRLLRRRESEAEGNRPVPALPELPPLVPDSPRKELPLPTPEALTPEPKTEPKITECPRCKNKLVDAAGLGWCSQCGYCHSLEQDRARAPVPTPTAHKSLSNPGTLDSLRLLVKVPSWFWVMLAGAVVVMLCTWLLVHSQRITPFGRCLWCTVQIGLGAVILFLASFWALLQVAAEDETITAKDVFLPVRLWTLTCKRLPKSRCQVWLAVWAAAGILSAAIFVGGLSEWFKYLPKASTAALSRPALTRSA